VLNRFRPDKVVESLRKRLALCEIENQELEDTLRDLESKLDREVTKYQVKYSTANDTYLMDGGRFVSHGLELTGLAAKSGA
jgi:hypothetical protein